MLTYLASTDSTNTRLVEYLRSQRQQGLCVDNLTTFYTDYQTAGRGQQGNSWESEAGQNLLFSTYLQSDISAECQFRISELVSVVIARVVAEVLSHHAPEHADAVKIKWPNDIYIYDKKVCGILIEHELQGQAVSSIIGVGLNVNQLLFRSPAPNPVSIRHYTTVALDIHPILSDILSGFAALLALLQQPEELHRLYMSMLYRREGYFRYMERECSVAPTSIVSSNGDTQTTTRLTTNESETSLRDASDYSAASAASSTAASAASSSAATSFPIFSARIVDVDRFGRLVLQDEAGMLHTYHFKQIRFVV